MRHLSLARRSLVFLSLLYLVLGGPAFAVAQTTDGRLVITVRDENDDMIAGARVVALNTETRQELEGTTSDDGALTLTPVPVGVYAVTVSADGFATKVVEKVKVDVGRDRGLPVELAVGEVSVVSTVYAGDSLVSLTGADVTTTVTERQLKDLPAASRDVLRFIQLQAGVSIDNGRGGVTINGQRTSSAIITRDGVLIQDFLIRSNALTFSPNRTTISQVAEFTVTTQNGGVDLAGSSAIRFVTPSGGNTVHGELFEYHRNDALGANSFFGNAADIERPQLIRNQFGVALSGPVVVPGLYDGRSRFFFFGTYEGLRERAADPLTAAVLTPAARAGEFTYVRRDNGRLGTINVLQASGVVPDPIAQMLLDRTPLPNSEFDGDLVTTAGYIFNKSRPRDRDQFAGRLDYVINPSHRVEAIYQLTDEVGGRSDIDRGFTIVPVVRDPSTTHFAVTAWNWNVADSITNELRVGLNNQSLSFTNDQEAVLPYFVVFTGLTQPQVHYDPQSRRTISASLIDNASWVWGDHAIRFGVRIDRIRLRTKQSFNVTPRISLSVVAATPSAFELQFSDFPGRLADTSDLLRANALLAMLGGLIGDGVREFNLPSISDTEFAPIPKIHNHEINQYAIYGVDQWRVHPRLTLNLGLRWDYTTPLRERDDLGLLPVTPGAAGLTDPDGKLDFIDGFYANPDKNNFAPNIGVAWDVFGDGKCFASAGTGQMRDLA